MRSLTPYSPDTRAFDQLVDWLEGPLRERPDDPTVDPGVRSVLLVGNDPLVSWLADRLCRDRSHHGPRRLPDVAIDKGELICLVHRKARWELVWTISADGAAETEAVLAKVRSKATVATALGTVVVGMTTFLLQNAARRAPTGFAWLALGTFAASALLYFATLFAYDTLLMPSRYWSSQFPAVHRTRLHGCPSLARPPTSTARVLQVAMVQIWSRVFTPATVLVGCGVTLLAISATPDGQRFDPTVQWWHVGLATAAVTVLCMGWVLLVRPDLGTSD